MSNKTKRILAAALACVLVLATMLSLVSPLFADEIDDLEQQQRALEEEAARAQELADATEEELEAAQAELDAAKEELNEINGRVSEVGNRIIDLNKKIEENQIKLEQKEVELAQAKEDLKVYYAALKGRIQMMYESDRSSYLEILLNASNVSDFFSKLEYISQMVEYDNNIMEQLDACRETIQKSKEAIEETKAELEADRAVEQEEQKALLAVQEEKQAVMEELESNTLAYSLLLDQQEAVVDQYWAKWSEADAQIDQIKEEEERRRQEEEQRRQEAEQNQQNQNSNSGETDGDGSEGSDGSDGEYYDPSNNPGPGDASDRFQGYGWSTWPGIGSGVLGWPVDSYMLSSLFGPRIHPISGEYKSHGGVDFDANYGQNIYAAGSGTVIEAWTQDDWGGGWGYYVVIQHDNGLQTLYAHCSSLAVSVGDYVSTGQTIAYVGSTGYSTGSHLHFEVYDGGMRVDPEAYL